MRQYRQRKFESKLSNYLLVQYHGQARDMQGYKNEKLIKAVCNGCGKQLRVKDGYLAEECFHAEHVFGYFSRKDGCRCSFDLCEDCLEKWMADFAVPADQEELSELV